MFQTILQLILVLVLASIVFVILSAVLVIAVKVVLFLAALWIAYSLYRRIRLGVRR